MLKKISLLILAVAAIALPILAMQVKPEITQVEKQLQIPEAQNHQKIEEKKPQVENEQASNMQTKDNQALKNEYNTESGHDKSGNDTGSQVQEEDHTTSPTETKALAEQKTAQSTEANQ